LDIRVRIAVALCAVLASVDSTAKPPEIRVAQPSYYTSSDEQLTKMQVFLQARELELEKREFDPFLSTTFFWGTKGLSGTIIEPRTCNPASVYSVTGRWTLVRHERDSLTPFGT